MPQGHTHTPPMPYNLVPGDGVPFGKDQGLETAEGSPLTADLRRADSLTKVSNPTNSHVRQTCNVCEVLAKSSQKV